MRSLRLRGFTLIEVMVALVIVSLALAGVAASMGQMIDKHGPDDRYREHDA
jgi:prepilin-type N-terminal cleavage/methylation domain-containing protein